MDHIRRALPEDIDQVGESKRRVPEMALGLVLVIGGALGAMLMYRSGTESQTVVASSRALQRGHVIMSSDLVAAEVPGDAAKFFVAGADAQSLVGQTLAVDIGSRVPLSSVMVSANTPLLATEALISAAVAVGNFPTEIAPGDHVRVVLAPEMSMSAATSPRMFETVVTVWSVRLPENFSDHAVITLRGSLDLATAVAGAGKVHIVLVGKDLATTDANDRGAP